MRKIKKLVATLLAATMVLAMGVTAFAADSLADGKYTAKQNLYKNSACTTTSMGDAALNDMRAEITIADDEANCLRRSLIRVQFRIIWIMLH